MSDAIQLLWFVLPVFAAICSLICILCFGGRFWIIPAYLLRSLIVANAILTSNAPHLIQAGTEAYLFWILGAVRIYGHSRPDVD